MKVRGFPFFEISWMLTYEILADSLLGSLFGLIFGYPLTVLVLSVNRTNLLNHIFRVNLETYLFALLLSLDVTLLVSLFWI